MNTKYSWVYKVSTGFWKKFAIGYRCKLDQNDRGHLGITHNLSIGVGGLKIFMELLFSATSQFCIETKYTSQFNNHHFQNLVNKNKPRPKKFQSQFCMIVISVYSWLTRNGREVKGKGDRHGRLTHIKKKNEAIHLNEIIQKIRTGLLTWISQNLPANLIRSLIISHYICCA